MTFQFQEKKRTHTFGGFVDNLHAKNLQGSNPIVARIFRSVFSCEKFFLLYISMRQAALAAKLINLKLNNER